jgi:lysophospholipase L1-like esterase
MAISQKANRAFNIKTMINNRRNFLATLSGALVGSSLISEAHSSPVHSLANVSTVLFQGDSITDGNRTRNKDWNHVMGHGYAYTIGSKLWFENPDRAFQFFNRGVSGNTITELTARWQTDTLDLKPDLLSILVGINDAGRAIKGDTTCTVKQFEDDYRSLLHQTLEKLPNVQLVLCEPFMLPVGRLIPLWDAYKQEVTGRKEAIVRLSREFKTIYVPFQSAFDQALSRAPADYWIWDGIHPMPAGHELMAREWLAKVGGVLEVK